MPGLPARISDWLLLLVRSQRSVAHLVVVGDDVLVDAGGDLDHYGLAGLERQRSACAQLPFLEGLLPLPETPFLLRSIGMPSGRVADIHFFIDDDAIRIVLLDVTAEHDEARQIQQKAYDMTLLSQREARLIAKLETAHKDLTLAHHELSESREALLLTHRRLRKELLDAERYVRAILPPPIAEPFAIDWRFVPSAELGGDSFGYYWIDPDHFALYLLDVCGHGVGSALLSIAAINTLRSRALPHTNFLEPAEVLSSLNRAYQMDDHAQLYLTIWYGVYHRPTGRLRYANAGHPPPILVTGPGGEGGEASSLPGGGPPVGMWPAARYCSEECTLVAPTRLFLFSDGVYEIHQPDGEQLEFAAFVERLTRGGSVGSSDLDELLRFARDVHGSEVLADDFSIVRMTI